MNQKVWKKTSVHISFEEVSDYIPTGTWFDHKITSGSYI
jgi:hypothetical protein